MQDNNMDNIWRDKLGGYQAPANPKDWADMAAMLDAQDEKRAGFYWWWLVAAALFITVGAGLFHLLQVHGEQIDAFAVSGGAGNSNGANTTSSNETNGTDDASTFNYNEADKVTNNVENNTNNPLPGNFNRNPSNNEFNENNTLNGGDTANTSSSNPKPSSKKSKNKRGNSKGNTNGKQTIGLSDIDNNKPNNTAKNTNGDRYALGNNNGGNYNTGANTEGYDKPVGTITVKRLKALPNPLALTISKDTIPSIWRDFLITPRKLQHYLGLSTGWSTSRVDRSGDFRSGYNVGLQYTMMIKNRAGFHAGLAFRSYNYFTDLVVCNYDIYQCPNSYSSTVQTIDLNIGAQVNLVKTEKVEWYVMGGVSNQFMLKETFDYNLPKVDTTNPQPVPQVPPTSTSFNGGGASDFESYMDASFNPSLTTGGVNGNSANGKFLRERYLGAWYAGTGVTWHFANRMNLQVEPVIGRSFQFVGIQDKKLWQSGVNVRLNMRLGR